MKRSINIGLIRATVALVCTPLIVSAVLAAGPSRVDSLSANLRADPLFAVDSNRAEIVDRLMTQWQVDIAANQRESVKQKLAGLRADRLLAVSLVGSFDGVLKVLYGQEQSDTALTARSALTAARSGGQTQQSKALGDADRDLVYTPLSPCRLFDTRTGQTSALGQLGGTFAPNTGRNIIPASACAIPASAVKNLFVSLTTLNNTPGSGGYITLLAPSAPVTTTTDIFNVNSQWSAANSIVTTGTAGQFVVYVATASAEVVVDVLGYFAPPPQPIGDITEVNTGTAATTGLTGGTASGIASLTLAPTFKLPQSCASGQVPKFNTTSGLWECQNDNAGSGTVTSVATGAGLTGGPISTSGTIAADTTYLQRRVSASCAVGSSIREIAADGAVTCQADTSASGTVTNVATGPGLTGGPISTSGTINLAATQLLPTVACAPTQIAKWNGSAWLCAADATVPNAWVQGGNAFGAPGVIGTTDAQPLTVRSGGGSVRVLTANDHGLRMVDASVAGVVTRINVINGLAANAVAPGIGGATISGGGYVDIANPSNNFPNQVLGFFGTVSGGFDNIASGYGSIVGGGNSNAAAGDYAVSSGGASNDATGERSTVSGGFLNKAGGDRASVGGGQQNEALGAGSSISGGNDNVVTGTSSSINGGQNNQVSGNFAAISGGSNNIASGNYSVVAGGTINTASGFYAATLAGRDNVAGGTYSVAMGRRAQSLGDGSFHFADSNNFDFGNSTANAFRVRATGGVRFVTDIDGTGAITWSCAAFAGASWACSSDRNLKHSLKKLDGRKVLAKLAAMPVYQWQPKGQNAHVKHVGPMAQDFMKAFGVGDDDKMIGMQDADGVALAAIQGLNQIVQAKDAKIAALEKANAVMQREMAAIKKRLGM